MMTDDCNMATDLEPTIEQTLEQARSLTGDPVYPVRTVDEVKQSLETFLAGCDLSSPEVHGLKRMGGGASKEQFVFDLHQQGQASRRCVLRMDPLESAVATNRGREFEILKIMHGIVPVPEPLWVDANGEVLGRPALIAEFVAGVTKPSKTVSNVSGFGTVLGDTLRKGLSVPFMKHLVDMHNVDWKTAGSDCFQAPVDDVYQAARWQLNWWVKVWTCDVAEGYPLMGLAESWMRDNLPAAAAEDLVYVHSDYRTGNYLFDEDSAEITSILDWELVHIGDYHEDLAWMAIKSWSHTEKGVLLASGLMPLDELCEQYSAATGRTIDRETLYFYQVLGLYKCVAICLATSAAAARRCHNHQDVLLSWLAASGYTFLADLHDLLEQGGPQ